MRLIRTAPITFAFALIMCLTTCVLALLTERADNNLLLELSTNLDHLARDPVRVLVASAFWVGGVWQLLLWVVLLVAVLAPVERRVGPIRMTLVFAAGHVGATLLVAAGLELALRFGAVNPAVADARDVGMSYGFLAVAAFATYLLEPRVRLLYGAALGSYLAVGVIMSTTFTDFGHLLAVLLGLCCFRFAGARPRLALSHGLSRSVDVC
jgi:rhomboid family protein